MQPDGNFVEGRSGFSFIEQLATSEERVQALFESVGEPDTWTIESEFDSFRHVANSLRSPHTWLRADALTAVRKIARAYGSEKIALCSLLEVPCVLELFRGGGGVETPALQECSSYFPLMCDLIAAAADANAADLPAAARRDYCLTAFQLLEQVVSPEHVHEAERLREKVWPLVRSLTDDASALSCVLVRAVGLEAREIPAALSNALWTQLISMVPVISVDVRAVLLPHVCRSLVRHLERSATQLVEVSDIKSSKAVMVWLQRSARLGAHLAVAPDAPQLVLAACCAAQALQVMGPAVTADGLPQFVAPLLAHLASTARVDIVLIAALAAPPPSTAAAAVRHSAFTVLLRAALPHLPASDLRHLWPVALRHATMVATHVPELLHTFRLSKNGHLSYAAVYRTLASLAVRILALDAEALSVLVPPLMRSLLHPHPLACRLASDVLAAMFARSPVGVRKRLIASGISMIKGAKREDLVGRPNRAYCQLTETLIGLVFESATTHELDLLYDSLIASEIPMAANHKRFASLSYVAVSLDFLPLVRLADKAQRHLTTSLLPLLQSALLGAREATADLIPPLLCLSAIYRQLPNVAQTTAVAQAITLLSRRTAEMHPPTLAVLLAFCDAACATVSTEQRVQHLLPRCADLIHDAQDAELLKQPIARFLRYNDYLRTPLNDRVLKALAPKIAVLMIELLDAGEWDVVFTMLNTLVPFAKFAPTECLNQAVSPAHATLCSRMVRGDPICDVEFLMEDFLRSAAATLTCYSLQVLAEDEVSALIKQASDSIQRLHQEEPLSLSHWQRSKLKLTTDLLVKMQENLK